MVNEDSRIAENVKLEITFPVEDVLKLKEKEAILAELSGRLAGLDTKRHFRGLSPDYDVGEYLCGICKENFETCPHVNVPLIPTEMKLRGVSVVRDPQMGTKFTDVLCVKTKKNRRSYRWIGFRYGVDSRQDRIDEMIASGQISETAATVFRRYFESHKSGECRFVETLSSTHPRGAPDYTNLRLANAKWKI
jgi:hypothetical protein